MSTWSGPGTLVLVTHGFTVRNLMGFVPMHGETIVLKPGSGSPSGGDPVGRIPPP